MQNDDLEKKNPVAQFFHNLWYDITHAFKYNNMLMCAIFFALPGLLIGFFISSHYSMIMEVSNTYNDYSAPVEVVVSGTEDAPVFTLNDVDIAQTVGGSEKTYVINITFTGTEIDKTIEGNKFVGKYKGTVISGEMQNSEFDKIELEISKDQRTDGSYAGSIKYEIKAITGSRSLSFKLSEPTANSFKYHKFNGVKTLLPFDLSAISIFFLMLVSVLNIFLALNLSGKKNLGSVVTATISTLVMLGLTATYFLAVFTAYNAVVTGLITRVNPWVWDTQKIWALSSIAVSDLLAIIGVILGWINYDRTYEKVDR